ETNNNFNRSKIQLKYGEELVLAFDLNPLIAGVDRDNHKRAIDNPKPAPLISVNSCTPPKW
ncbi:MAG: hypothetical protein NT027_07790, partial [Proteobacteria bacterium]|nr:hypothetical protein [Pseudomonadota bacterium]